MIILAGLSIILNVLLLSEWMKHRRSARRAKAFLNDIYSRK
jgi:hypothetical protein